jgi:ABC-type branched-subunit amino acid transport system substrate-binding protein
MASPTTARTNPPREYFSVWQRLFRGYGPLAVFALLLVAMSVFVPTKSPEAVSADGFSSGTGTGTGTASGTGAGTGTAAGTPTGGATTGGSAASGGTEGSAGSSGGEAAAGEAAPAAGGECTPQPTDEIGVTDTEITIANIATITGPIAGFGTTAQNAVKAYVNFVNSQGGVCGRTIVLQTADDRLDTATNRSETERLAGSSLGFVGGISVVDNGGADVIGGTNIPDVTLAIGSVRARLPNNFSPNPIPASGNGAAAPLSYFAQQGVTSAAIVYPNQSDARSSGQAYLVDLAAAGINDVDQYEVSITETNYVNVAQQIENAGSQLVITTLEVSGMAKLAQAFAQIGYQPQVPFYGAQAYGGQFLELAGDAANGTTLAVTFSIFEDAGAVPAMATFLEWYQRTAPGSDPDFFSIMGWAAADMLVDAIAATNGSPTRDNVIAALQAQTAYDGDGFLAVRNPPAKEIGGCFAVITVENGAWRRVEPASGFRC